MPTTLKTGDAAPPFEMESDRGESVSIAGLAGKWVVLYWYPKDDTPGCTTEACEIRDNFELISGEAELFGVSPDSVKSHQKFRDKFSLPFPLLADAEHKVSDAYGVWHEAQTRDKTGLRTSESRACAQTVGIRDDLGAVRALCRENPAHQRGPGAVGAVPQQKG